MNPIRELQRSKFWKKKYVKYIFYFFPIKIW
jgi:hypothetical protein